MFSFYPQEGAKYRFNYEKLAHELNKAQEANDFSGAMKKIRAMSQEDLFFLMYFTLGISEVNHPWLVARINEVNDLRHKTLDVWARYHWKSRTITVAGTIQDVIRDPLHRVCIFSHTKSIAKDFLRSIKTIMETNGLLKTAFADIIPYNPINQKGWMWSLDDGLQLKNGDGMGGYIMASGLIDSMPTGKHFTRRIYDDVVTRDSVATLEQRRKVAECVKLSHALGDPFKGTHCFIGTRYHWGDYYGELISSKEYKVREYACTHNGEYPLKPEGAVDEVQQMGDGISILYPQEHIWDEFKLMGADTFAAQMLLNPIKADERGFNVDWLKYYDTRPHTRNFIFVDPAGEKKEDSDYTVMWVVGIDTRGYYYVLDCVRDRLNLLEKQQKLFALVEKWRVLKVYYEKYSIQGDIEYIKEKQTTEGCHFAIEPVGGTRLTKEERILKLQPLFQEGKIIFPPAIWYTDVKGKRHNLVEDFITEEYVEFPVSQYRDMLDALARIRDEKVRIAGPTYIEPHVETKYNPLKIEPEYSDAGWLNQ